MNWLVILYLLVPTPSGPALQTEVSRELVRLSTLAACNAYGTAQAARWRQAQGTPLLVQHHCIELPAAGAAT